MLENSGAAVGIVSSIVGMRQLRLTFSGRQGHAGGSPMAERADAGLAAMRYAARLDDAIAAAGLEGNPVWTFPALDGFISHSTVPGEANLTLQFRAPSEETLEAIQGTIQRGDQIPRRASRGCPYRPRCSTL